MKLSLFQTGAGQTKKLSVFRLLFTLLLIIGLPIFVWAVATQRLELRKKAATSEPPIVCWGRAIPVSTDAAIPADLRTYQWPDSCVGNPSPSGSCAHTVVPLSASEHYRYNQWISAGRPFIPGCGPTPTPSPQPECDTCNSNIDCNPGLICQSAPTPTPNCPNGPNGPCSIPMIGSYKSCVKPDGTSQCPPTQPPPGCHYFPSSCTNSIPKHCSYTLDCSPTHPPITPYTGAGCVRTGCSGQLCAQENSQLATTCKYSPQYGCYNSARCEVQANGQCGWTQTDSLNQCLASYTNPIPCNDSNAGTVCPAGYTCHATITPIPTTTNVLTVLKTGGWSGICLPGPYNQVMCTGQNNGAACNTGCAPCPPGRACPAVCLLQQGTCQNGQCVPNVIATPTPVSCSGQPNGTFCTLCLYQGGKGGCGNWGICTNGLCMPPPATPTPSPTPTSLPTPTPTPYPQTMQFWVKLAGVTDNSANGALIHVKFYLKDGSILQLPALPLSYMQVTTSGGPVGIYTATTTISNPLPAGTQYRVQIKGEKHIAVRFCKEVGQTGPCDDNDYITMPTNDPQGAYYILNFTSIPLPAGDLNQDGAADSADVKLFTDLWHKPPSQLTPADYKLADVDYSGSIDQFDLIRILQTLSTRYDE